MAGGNFDINVGKTRPGTYVNVKSKRQQKAKGSTRGIAVIPLSDMTGGRMGNLSSCQWIPRMRTCISSAEAFTMQMTLC